MPEKYVASDKRTGVEVAVTGDFPAHPDDRMRIARTTTLFTRLTSTLLVTESDTERRAGFRAVETQLELAATNAWEAEGVVPAGASDDGEHGHHERSAGGSGPTAA